MIVVQIPPQLQQRLANLKTTNLGINIPHGSKVTPQELIAQLEQFVTDIETGKAEIIK